LARSKGLSEDDSLKMAYKHVGALYSTSEVNGVPEIMEISPERVYPTENLRAEFDTQINTKLDELAAAQGWELSEDRRSYTSTIDGVKYKSPLKIMPIPSVTYFQHKSQSPVTTWMIIDGRDGNDFTRFTTVSVDSSVTREAARQNISTLSANKNQLLKRLDMDNVEFQRRQSDKQHKMTEARREELSKNKLIGSPMLNMIKDNLPIAGKGHIGE
jgi:hypothetical protein